MASVNPLSRELVFKIVYYGPGLGGKTTTLEYLHTSTKPEHRGKLVSLATPVDRTLYFDFLPIRLPPVRGMSIRLQLFTVPGQVYFNATRKLVLTGADGIVFVGDSQLLRADANLESLENLRENLREQGRDLEQIPIVFQHNKRDLPDLLPLAEMDQMLNPSGAHSVATCARTGEGVYESLSRIAEGVLRAFEARMPQRLDAQSAAEELAEEGLASALRSASASAADDVVVARLSTNRRDWGSIPPDATIGDAEIEGPIDDATELTARATPGLHLPMAAAEDRAPTTILASPAPPAAPIAARPKSEVPRQGAGVSFAELWGEVDQAMVRELESAIANGRYTLALELCETLVSRVLASAASLFGTTDAPRDAAVVPLLLGLDGRRYLSFRALVRAARSGTIVTARDALTAYALLIDARIARNSIV
jgi:signal recognition particle receptor subunit beta